MGGADEEIAEPKMQVSQEEIVKNRLPLQWRDFCAHKLIPLNKCRHKNYYLPFRCEDERHAYEKCQYDQYMRRVGEMKALVKEQKRVAREEAENTAKAARKAAADAAAEAAA